jgi:hypothetical protein
VSSNADAALAIIHRSDSRVWVTPFAGPVLPEVKKITAGLEGDGGSSEPRGAASRSASRLWGESKIVPPPVSAAP